MSTSATKKYSVAIVGGGHNGLVCAAYLARAGYSVTVYEKRSLVGGLCVTEELFPGYKVSSVASYFGMLRQEIIQDLLLEEYGLQPYLTNPAEVILLPDRQLVFTPRDADSVMRIAGITASELSGWKEFWSDIARAAHIVYPLYFKPETNMADVQQQLSDAGLNSIAPGIFTDSLLTLAAKYFAHESLLAAVATCTPGFANMPGTIFGCLHHGTASTLGHFGAWGLVKGGMGSVTEALRRAAVDLGVRIFTRTPVRRIVVENNVASGVELFDGSRKGFDVVASNADLKTTFEHLLNQPWPKTNSGGDFATSAGKIHFALRDIPEFTELATIGASCHGIVVHAPRISSVIADSHNVPQGQLPSEPMLTMAFPSLTDPQCAPPGRHLLTVDIHYLPAMCQEGWTSASESALLKSVIGIISSHAPRFQQCIENVHIVTPETLRTSYNLMSSSCWHVPLTPQHLFENRRLSSSTPYSTPVRNLFLCGAGTYGGGNVSGVPGYNCAHSIATSLTAPVAEVQEASL